MKESPKLTIKRLQIQKVLNKEPRILHILVQSSDTKIYIDPKWMTKTMTESIIRILQGAAETDGFIEAKCLPLKSGTYWCVIGRKNKRTKPVFYNHPTRKWDCADHELITYYYPLPTQLP